MIVHIPFGVQFQNTLSFYPHYIIEVADKKEAEVTGKWPPLISDALNYYLLCLRPPFSVVLPEKCYKL